MGLTAGLSQAAFIGSLSAHQLLLLRRLRAALRLHALCAAHHDFRRRFCTCLCRNHGVAGLGGENLSLGAVGAHGSALGFERAAHVLCDECNSQSQSLRRNIHQCITARGTHLPSTGMCGDLCRRPEPQDSNRQWSCCSRRPRCCGCCCQR